MSLPEYLIKFTLGISLVYLFYRIFLHQHTFYNWNRFYLLGYSLMAFALPFVNITPWLDRKGIDEVEFINNVPPVKEFIATASEDMSLTGWLLMMFGLGVLIAVGRLALQFSSYVGMRKRSVMIHKEGNVRIYESNNLNTAFSFGNDIFINTSNHTSEELERIMLHEIVHVKHRHTFDLAVSELVCILNWFNPFAWKLRSAIKQNLEFIADQNVLSRGHDRKQYQYLLLKVIGVPQYHIANHFNISDLKKRIAMMNKIKTARVHLFKFVFSVPLIAVILLSFRSKDDANATFVPTETVTVPFFLAKDTVPANADRVIEPEQPFKKEKFNRKGYAISVVTTKGEPLVIIREKGSNAVVAITMTDWNKSLRQNEEKYGKLPPPVPPVPPVPPAPPKTPVLPPEINNGLSVINGIGNDQDGELSVDVDVDVDADFDIVEHQEIQAFQEKLANEQLKIEIKQQNLQLEAEKFRKKQMQQRASTDELKASKSKRNK